MLENILAGVVNLLVPYNLFAIFFGLVFGMVMGALPGLTSTMAVALFVPFTFAMPPEAGLIALGAIYTASTFGGSLSAILINIPGTPASVATTWDGYPLAQRGEAGKALSMSTVASCFGGLVSALALLTLAPPLAAVALRFGPPEIFALAVLGLSVVSSLSGESLLKGLIACVLGLLIGSVGGDPVSGFPRFTFGQPFLLTGVSLIPMIIGLFAIPEVLFLAERKARTAVNVKTGSLLLTLKDLKNSIVTFIKGSVIGVIIGIIPAASPDVAAFISYGEARRSSKHPESYGKGNLDGVAAAEVANNAVSGGSLIPLLTLSIPGSATAAIFLGALYIHGLLPGPLLFTQQTDIVYTFFMGFIVVNILMLPLGLLAAKLSGNVVRIPREVMGAVVLMLCVVGSYAISFSLYDVWIMFTAGILSYLMQKRGFPVAPIILAIILGPLAEANWDRSILMGFGSPAIFLGRPIALGLFAFALLTLMSPYIPSLVARIKKRKEASTT